MYRVIGTECDKKIRDLATVSNANEDKQVLFNRKNKLGLKTVIENAMM